MTLPSVKIAVRAIEGGAVDYEIEAFWATSLSTPEEHAALLALEEKLSAIAGAFVDVVYVYESNHCPENHSGVWGALGERRAAYRRLS